MYRVLLTTAVWCDHLVQILTGLSSLVTSPSDSVLISGARAALIGPAFAPIGLIPALKKGELCTLGRARASRRVMRKIRGMLENTNDGAAGCVVKLGCSSDSGGLSVSSGS